MKHVDGEVQGYTTQNVEQNFGFLKKTEKLSAT